MTFVSHRGAAGIKKENTLEAIKIGHAMRPKYVEIDIHRTKDKVFVLYHGSMRSAYMGTDHEETYQHLKQRNSELLTLDEFIKYAPNKPYLLDIKIKITDDKLIKTLKTMPNIMHGAFASPHPRTLLALKNAFPHAKAYISQPYQEGPFRPLILARRHSFDGICLNKWWIGPLVVRACRISKKEILTYTVDRGITMRVIKRFYPDVTIITNRPDTYHSLFLSKKKLLKK